MRKAILSSLVVLVLATTPARAADPVLTGPAQQLSEVGIEYDNDIGQDVGYMILTWNNTSPNIQDNNQITAETGFGSNSGLYDIDALTSPFTIWPSMVYNINPDSSTVNFNELFNAPENTLKLKYQFESTNWVSQMQDYLAGDKSLAECDQLKMSYITATAAGTLGGTLDFNNVEVVCPTSPEPKPFFLSLNNNSVTLSNLTQGLTYTLQKTDSLTNNWNDVVNFTASGNETNLPYSKTNSVSFFRGKVE